MGYKYFIKSHGEMYYFGLYPNNNNRQPLAISTDYLKYENAKDGIELLKDLLKRDSNMFKMRKEERGYTFYLTDNEFQLAFFRSKVLYHRYEVLRCINRIYKNCEAPLKLNIERDI